MDLLPRPHWQSVRITGPDQPGGMLEPAEVLGVGHRDIANVSLLVDLLDTVAKSPVADPLGALDLKPDIAACQDRKGGPFGIPRNQYSEPEGVPGQI